jgi:hypothetical protein
MGVHGSPVPHRDLSIEPHKGTEPVDIVSAVQSALYCPSGAIAAYTHGESSRQRERGHNGRPRRALPLHRPRSNADTLGTHSPTLAFFMILMKSSSCGASKRSDRCSERSHGCPPPRALRQPQLQLTVTSPSPSRSASSIISPSCGLKKTRGAGTRRLRGVQVNGSTFVV